MKEHIKFVRDNVKEHTKWFRESIPLIASENVISPLVREMLTTDFHNRYAEGVPYKRYYQGNIYVDKVEERANELGRKLFDAKYCDVRPTSGTAANQAMFFKFAKPGQDYTSCNVADGAHISSAKFGAAGVRGLVEHTYPFNVDEMNIDIDGTIKLIKEVKPKIALFGMSVFLFPTPLKELQEAFDETGCTVWYDGAHVLGLIAGGEFQQPLREGAHILTGSTHKTLPGPQGGVVLGNPRDQKMEDKMNYGVFPGVLSNHHLHHMAGKAIAFAEAIEFGKQYAKDIIKNAQALAQALDERGFKVLAADHGFTKSHALVMDVNDIGGGTPLVEALEQANVITNKNLLPWDPANKALNPSGIRLGTAEVTRIGMGPQEMAEIADIFKEVCIDKKDPKVVRERVKELKRSFTKVHYCFNDGAEAYSWLDVAGDI